MSEIKVVKLFQRNRQVHHKSTDSPQPFENEISRTQIIAIGASTGGPIALQAILSRLPSNMSVPVLIVQHIAPGFVQGFQKMLSATSGITLKIAEDGEKLLPGIGYIAPDTLHMGVSKEKRISLSDQATENGSKPSVSFLFRSVASVYGANALGVLLTGMGKDGAEELKDLNDLGALTVVQNEESSVVFGMPSEALRIGASTSALTPEDIAGILAKAGATSGIT
jgi:two-component system chemotaxis response regulator CheB